MNDASIQEFTVSVFSLSTLVQFFTPFRETSSFCSRSRLVLEGADVENIVI